MADCSLSSGTLAYIRVMTSQIVLLQFCLCHRLPDSCTEQGDSSLLYIVLTPAMWSFYWPFSSYNFLWDVVVFHPYNFTILLESYFPNTVEYQYNEILGTSEINLL